MLTVKVLQAPLSEITRTLLVGIPHAQWSLVKSDFLFLNPVKSKVHTAKGALILDTEYLHKLYVKGFWVSDMKDEGA